MEDDTTFYKIDPIKTLKLCETETSLSLKLHATLAFETALDWQNANIVKLQTSRSFLLNKSNSRARAPSTTLTNSTVKFNETFKFSGEIILKEFSCKLVTKAKVSAKYKEGILIISQNYISFRSTGFAKKKEAWLIDRIAKATRQVNKAITLSYQSDDKTDEIVFIFEEEGPISWILEFMERIKTVDATGQPEDKLEIELLDRELTEEDWAIIEKATEATVFQKKQIISPEKCADRVLWRVTSGTAVAEYSAVYINKLDTSFTAGQIYGALSFMLSVPNYSVLKATEQKVEVKQIPGYYLDILFSYNKALGARFWYHLASKLALQHLTTPATITPTPAVRRIALEGTSASTSEL